MLAQVAGRIFWMSRYLERSESIARIVNAYSQLIMDLPRGTELEWNTILKIFGLEEAFESRELYLTEYAVIQLLTRCCATERAFASLISQSNNLD